MARKGQLHMQFNWIFVIIAGFAFLGFFTLIASNAIKGSDQATDLKVASRLETLLKDMRSSSSSYKEIELPSFDIEIVCDEERSFFRSEERTWERSLRTALLFSPGHLKGESLHLFTLPLTDAFPVEQSIFMTDVHHAYIFEDDPWGFSQQLYERMGNVSKELLHDPSKTKLSGVEQITSIAFVERGRTPSWMDSLSSRGRVILIEMPREVGQDVFSSALKVNFYERGIKKGDTWAWGISSLIGAIMSGSKERYECAMQKQLQRSSLLADLLLMRISSMQEELNQTRPSCTRYYQGNIENNLITIRESEEISEQSLNDLASAFRGLEWNHRDIELVGCPHVY